MGLSCEKCGREVGMTTNGSCYSCHKIEYDAWQAKLAIRQDPAQFKLDELVRALLTQHWQHECRIIPDYLPPFPGKDTSRKCVVFWAEPDGRTVGLRYSKGPAQGYFWDVYADDMHSPELALIALSRAPPPPRVDFCIPTHGH